MKFRRPQTLAATIIWALTFFVLPVVNAKGAKLLISWKNPDYSGQKRHRVLVIGMSENPEIRLDFEDDLSSAIANDGLEAVPGNSILFRPQSAELKPDYLKGQIRDFKIDAILPYTYYGSFYGYYGAVYRQVYTPDYLREDTTVRVETNFYAATPPNELIWTGTSDSFNPKSAKKVIDELVKLIVKELTKQNLL
jgi:hypothetical protein